MTELEKYRRNVTKCIRCGICRSKYNYEQKVFRVCPSGEHSAGFWTNFPSGRVAMALEILEGNLNPSDAPIQAIYECLLCANCREKCGAIDIATGKPLIDHPAIVKALRADFFAAGVEVPEAVIKFGDTIEKTCNIFGAPPEERTDWLLPEIKVAKEAGTVYFPGCLAAYRSAEIPQATAKILNNLGIEFSIMGEEEHCCGDPMIMVGQLFLARELARYNWEHLKDKKIITSCAGCHRTFKEEYPKLLGEEYKIDSVHIVELLAGLIDGGKVKFTGKIEEKVTYHDPCELGREMKVFDQPRKIIQSIPGIELVELERNRENTWCCGGGGGVKGVNYEMSIEIGKDTVEEALATGATTLVSACPSCKTNINDAVKAAGEDFRVIDIVELVAEAGISLV
ncbi:(Fe-S)-binding protein [Chloroflexota bacterium]